MNVSTRFVRSLTRRIPRIKGAHRLARFLSRATPIGSDVLTQENVLSFRMILAPFDHVDRQLFFSPQLYDRWEISVIRNVVRAGDTALDVGANIGFYSMVFSELVGETGKVLAIEAAPDTYQRLLQNIELNHFRNIIPVNLGVSDAASELTLWIRSRANSGANSLIKTGENCLAGPKVSVLPLIDILRDRGITAVKFAKFDIEGMERRVLKRFFQEAPQELFPEYILGEDNNFPVENGGASHARGFHDILVGYGYKEIGRNKINQIYRKIRGKS
jgi:FkbM family methyltransferase